MIIEKVVIHCSASPQGRGDNAETIHKWHRARGWDGIGYHWVILENGTAQAGRPHYWTGAHVAGHNAGSIGICLIGDESFTPMQYQVLANLLENIKDRNPGVKIYGHYELDDNKTCPNFDVPKYLRKRGLN